jgi:hypothetical protein
MGLRGYVDHKQPIGVPYWHLHRLVLVPEFQHSRTYTPVFEADWSREHCWRVYHE